MSPPYSYSVDVGLGLRCADGQVEIRTPAERKTVVEEDLVGFVCMYQIFPVSCHVMRC